MKALESQIKEFDKAIAAQMELLPNVLISIPGIGPVFSAGIMAEIGDINRFGNHAQLAKYAGLAWKQHQSGGFEAQTTRLINSGNRFLKYYLCEAAFSLVRCDKEYSDFYHLKYKEVNRYQHKRALALTARKFVRLVFVLLKDNRKIDGFVVTPSIGYRSYNLRISSIFASSISNFISLFLTLHFQYQHAAQSMDMTAIAMI